VATRVAVDLDGVLNAYDGWKGEEHWPEPRPGAGEFLRALEEAGFSVCIFTTRDPDRTQSWLSAHGLWGCCDEVTDRKEPAVCYVDDRAVCFRGDFGETLAAVLGFKTHWEAP
jgi:hypothetical protein